MFTWATGLSFAVRGAAAIVFAASLLALGVAPPARADEEPSAAGQTLEILDAAGNPDTQAGTHPDRMVTRLFPKKGDTEHGRELEIDFPTGMGGDPAAIPTCTEAELDAADESGCPIETRIGSMKSTTLSGEESVFPIFNMVPGPGEFATFAVQAEFLRFKLSNRFRAGDFGLTTQMTGLLQQTFPEPARETVFEFWGIPADHQVGGTAPRKAFLTLPTACGRPLSVTVRSRTWEHPENVTGGVAETSQPLTGCSQLPFTPAIHFRMETPAADTPTGFGLAMEFPETQDIDGLASSQPRGARVEFPQGMGISPGAATHFTACSDAQLALGAEAPASCPLSAKVGTVEIGAPQLPSPLKGNVYLGAERPGERFRLFVVARGNGAESKFAGTMEQDPVTGRLTTVLDGLPQASFSSLLMHFDGGPGALFVAPSGCGPATVNATITPYSGTDPVHASDSVTVGPRAGRRCGEAGPFAPNLEVAVGDRRAGRSTSFTTMITRKDGEQSIDSFSLAFPAGLSASLGAVEPCSDAAVAASSCPASSQLGTASVAVGTGIETATLKGDTFLTGPTKGQPFGVAMVFSAKIGPFDFGTLGVQAAMTMDPLTGQVTVQSGSLPQNVQGIPIRFQAIQLRIDRPGFMRTPTSCEPEDVRATIASTEGATARPTGTLAMRGCVGLPFRPSLSLALTDRKELHAHGRPGMRIKMRARPGEANMDGMTLALPAALHFSPGALKEICARRAALRGKCPDGARVGTGTGHTTLLSTPLKGSVYVVQPKGTGEPDLWTNLHGGGIELNLRSTSRTKHGQTENGFAGLPDVPLTEFEVEFADHGVISLKSSLCRDGRQRRLAVGTRMSGHNGAVRKLQVPLAAPKVCSGR